MNPSISAADTNPSTATPSAPTVVLEYEALPQPTNEAETAPQVQVTQLKKFTDEIAALRAELKSNTQTVNTLKETVRQIGLQTGNGKEVKLPMTILAQKKEGDDVSKITPSREVREAFEKAGADYHPGLKQKMAADIGEGQKAEFDLDVPVAQIKMSALDVTAGKSVTSGGSLGNKMVVLVSNDQNFEVYKVNATLDGVPVQATAHAAGSSQPAALGAISAQSVVPNTAVEIDVPKELAQKIGSHELKVDVEDVAGNKGTLQLTGLKVQETELRVTDTPVNLPNPFNPRTDRQTLIRYSLSQDSDITVYIYDMSGRMIVKKTVPSGAAGGAAGLNELPWDGRSDFGADAGNGVYSYVITARGKILARGQMSVWR